MKNKIKYLSVMMVLTLSAIACIACSSGGGIGNTSSENISTDESSSEILSSQETVSSKDLEVSSITLSKEVSSTSVSSSSVVSKAVSSQKPASVSSKTSTSSQSKQKPVYSQSSKATSKPISDNKPDFGELMDEATVDAIFAEGIEYANSKGMTYQETYTVDGNGYYNPAFSGDGAEIFKRDLFYHIDQVYDIALSDPWYVEGNSPYYKVVKGEFEKGHWYGYVLY